MKRVVDTWPLLGRLPEGGRMKAAPTHATWMVRGWRGRCQGRQPLRPD
jgi:hypothetical protein